MAKVLFLDIDGVLNSNFWNDSHQSIKETNAKIILHSGWRFWFDSELKPLCMEAKQLCKKQSKFYIDFHILDFFN